METSDLNPEENGYGNFRSRRHNGSCTCSSTSLVVTSLTSLDTNYCQNCVAFFLVLIYLLSLTLPLLLRLTLPLRCPYSFLLFYLLLHPLRFLPDPRPHFSNLCSSRSASSMDTGDSNNLTIPVTTIQQAAQSTGHFAKSRKIPIPFLRRLSIPSLINSAI